MTLHPGMRVTQAEASIGRSQFIRHRVVRTLNNRLLHLPFYPLRTLQVTTLQFLAKDLSKCITDIVEHVLSDYTSSFAEERNA